MSRKAYGGGLLKEKDVCGVGMEQPLWINMGKRGVRDFFFQFEH